MMFSLQAGSRRNTKCYIATVGGTRLYISYETVVAADTSEGRLRLKNHWGPTTGKHLREMGAYDYKVVPDEELEAAIDRDLAKYMLSHVTDKLKGASH